MVDHLDTQQGDYSTEIQNFLKNHLLFRDTTYTWQDIMRLDPEMVEWKAKAEMFGKEHLIGYTKNTDGKLLWETPRGNQWLDIGTRYDESFMKAFVEMVKKKAVLINNGGEEYIRLLERFKNDMKAQHEKGYLAMGADMLLDLFPLFVELGGAERLFISESTMTALINGANGDHQKAERYKTVYRQMLAWQQKGKLTTPFKENAKLVSRKGGFLNLKTYHPSWEDREISSFLPSVKEGKDILYIGYRWLKNNQGHWGVPIYSFPDGIDYDIKMELLMGESIDDLLELNSKVLYLPSFPEGYYDYLYHG